MRFEWLDSEAVGAKPNPYASAPVNRPVFIIVYAVGANP